jgi:hypothetical protein
VRSKLPLGRQLDGVGDDRLGQQRSIEWDKNLALHSLLLSCAVGAALTLWVGCRGEQRPVGSVDWSPGVLARRVRLDRV